MEAKSGSVGLPRWLGPKRFAASVMAGYLLLCLPILALHRFDPAIFVVAGSRWVDVTRIAAKLPVRAPSNGYDGQFYYRLAQHPLSIAPQAGGITFDHPAKRFERILYPLAAWMASFGLPRATAFTLFALNLAGLGVIAWIASALANRLRLSPAIPLSIVLWPGFIVTLLHDTAEIFSTALMLGALSAVLRGRWGPYAVLSAGAVLARETTVPIFAGVMLATLPWPGTDIGRSRRAITLCAAPLAAFALWQQVVGCIFQATPQAQGVAQDIGWPMVGAVQMLSACITGARRWASTPLRDAAERVVVLLTALPLLGFIALVATRLRAASRDLAARGLLFGWVLIALLMSTLAAGGPWIDPDAYLRAFTECFVVGCLLLGLAGLPFRSSWLPAVTAGEMLLSWGFCMARMR